MFIVLVISCGLLSEAGGAAALEADVLCKARLIASAWTGDVKNIDEEGVAVLTPGILLQDSVGWLDETDEATFERRSPQILNSPGLDQRLLVYILVFGANPKRHEKIFSKVSREFDPRPRVFSIMKNLRTALAILSYLDQVHGTVYAMEAGVEILQKLEDVPRLTKGNGEVIVQLRGYAQVLYPEYQERVERIIRQRFAGI